MVDSTPTGVGPPSTIRSIRPPRSTSTCCAEVGETCPERFAEGATTGPPKVAQDFAANRMIGHANGDAIEPGRRQFGYRASGGARQHQGQGAGPELRRQPLGIGVENRQFPRGRDIGDMRDQRIEGRPALGLIEPRHRLAVAGIGAEPVDGLGRKRHQPARAQALRGGLDGGAVGAAGSGGFSGPDSWSLSRRLLIAFCGRDDEKRVRNRNLRGLQARGAHRYKTGLHVGV